MHTVYLLFYELQNQKFVFVSFFQLLARDFSFFFTEQLEDKFVSRLGYVTIIVGSCERLYIVKNYHPDSKNINIKLIFFLNVH